MDRITHLETFVAVAEAESFSIAAERLDLSRAVTSKHVQLLEDRLGVRLLERTTRRVRVTDAGRQYLERARRILSELDEAEVEARGDRVQPSGLLRVNGPVSFARAHLASAMPVFLARYPDLSVALTVNDRVVDLLEEGYDVAIRIGRLADSSLVARKLAPVQLHLAASPGYLSANGIPKRPAELSGHECFGYAYSSDGGVWRFKNAAGEEETMRPRGRFSANNGEILTEAALGGAGLVLQPDFVLGPHFQCGALVPVLPDWKHLELTVNAVHHQSRYVAAKIRAFVDHLAAEWRDPPWRLPQDPGQA